jgi:hypothetical protein
MKDSILFFLPPASKTPVFPIATYSVHIDFTADPCPDETPKVASSNPSVKAALTSVVSTSSHYLTEIPHLSDSDALVRPRNLTQTSQPAKQSPTSDLPSILPPIESPRPITGIFTLVVAPSLSPHQGTTVSHAKGAKARKREPSLNPHHRVWKFQDPPPCDPS